MTTNTYEKCSSKDGARLYKSKDYANKISMNLHNLKRDGRFCDIDLVSGSTRVKVHRLESHYICKKCFKYCNSKVMY